MAAKPNPPRAPKRKKPQPANAKPAHRQAAPRNPRHAGAAAEPNRFGYWMVGAHAVQAALDNPHRAKRRLLVTENALAKWRIPLSLAAKIKPELVTPAELDTKLGHGGAESSHQGIALEVQPLPGQSLEKLAASGQRLVMLDQVTDPHNIGAILRSAAAFGAAGVIVQDKNAPPENATIAKTAVGALELVPLLRVTNLSRAIEALQDAGYWAIGLDGEAESEMAALDLPAQTLLVMGAEGKGLRRLVGEHCNQLVKLPIHPQMESLNVSVAAGIALYELARRGN